MPLDAPVTTANSRVLGVVMSIACPEVTGLTAGYPGKTFGDRVRMQAIGDRGRAPGRSSCGLPPVRRILPGGRSERRPLPHLIAGPRKAGAQGHASKDGDDPQARRNELGHSESDQVTWRA